MAYFQAGGQVLTLTETTTRRSTGRGSTSHDRHTSQFCTTYNVWPEGYISIKAVRFCWTIAIEYRSFTVILVPSVFSVYQHACCLLQLVFLHSQGSVATLLWCGEIFDNESLKIVDRVCQQKNCEKWSIIREDTERIQVHVFYGAQCI